VKDYGFMFREDGALCDDAARVSAIARDISEYLTGIGVMPPVREAGLTVAYHSACSLQHGQKVTAPPKTLLQAAGFRVVEPREAHLCCGSAGTYNMLQPDLATQLRDRKVANIVQTQPDVIAAGNLGCMTQLAGGTDIPIVHTIELLDWATGGPKPEGMAAPDAAPR
jgi:glycolate oxidase iron-sulfur subunit